MKHLRVALLCSIVLCSIGHVGESLVAQTWSELVPLGSPPDPIYYRKPAHYDAANNRLIVFFPGTLSHGGFGNQVWILTHANGLGGTPEWLALQPTGSPPFVNGDASVVYDAFTNRLLVYGGCVSSCAPALTEVFSLSYANGLGGIPTWTQVSVTNPQARAEQSAIYDASTDQLIVFGGHLAFFGTDRNDTRLLSNASGATSPSTWSSLAIAGPVPAIRNAHTALYDPTTNRMMLFGGRNFIQTCCPYIIRNYNDVWVLSHANGQGGASTWTRLAPLGVPPSGRAGHAAVYDPMHNRMVVFGGDQWQQQPQTDLHRGDLWELSHANGLGGLPTWTQLPQFGALPGARFFHAAAFDVANQRMIVMGGRDRTTDTPSNRVWVLDLTQTATEVGGFALGLRPQTAHCTNVTTGKSVALSLQGETFWNCEDAGLVVNTGDRLRLDLRGTAK